MADGLRIAQGDEPVSPHGDVEQYARHAKWRQRQIESGFRGMENHDVEPPLGICHAYQNLS